jgi:hypothetical protein
MIFKMRQQIIDSLQKTVNEFEFEGSLANIFKKYSREQLEEISVDLQALYLYGNHDEMKPDLIDFSHWLVFKFWEPEDQTGFLAYLSCKIALMRLQESETIADQVYAELTDFAEVV